MLGSGHTLDDLFGSVLKKKERDSDDEDEFDQTKRRPLRRWDYEKHCWVEVDPNSSNPEDLLATPAWMRKEPKWLQRKVLDDAGLVSPAKKERDSDDEDEFDQTKRRPLRRWDYEKHCWVEVDPNSSNPEDLLATPAWMRKEPKWLQRKVLDDAGLVSPAKKEREELVKHEQPSEETIEKAKTQWDELGQLPHTKQHVRFDDDDIKTEHVNNDDEDTACLPSGPRKKMLYNFCLNRDCPQYHIRDLPIQQNWRGECCGMRNQPAPGGGIIDPTEQEDEESEEDWEITDNLLQEIMDDDPETGKMLQKVQGFYDEIDEEIKPSPTESAAYVAVLAVATLACPEYEIFPVAEEEEEESEEDSSDSEDSTIGEACFLSQCNMLIEGTTQALDGMVCEPFTSLLAELKASVEAYVPGSPDDIFDQFRVSSLELIRKIRSEFYTHKRQNKPPKTQVVIDGQVYDI
eukprot:TRINITY_DN16477_c0_g1_i1.p1 TRINITY_DN16477_c0_g1~~TRINITY_DN16477_c0_g1_i1.p1  ORF type:complete len:482 (+),score=126.37 TRINITY_DN16477_c0_g1_i1:68-1447(+)